MKPRGGKGWREGKAWETKWGRSWVRDILGDEQEGSPPKKMHCGWSPPEVEHSITIWGRVSFWAFLPICVCQSFQSGLGLLFQGLLRVFFFFFKFLFMATSAPTKRMPSSWSVTGVIKACLSHASLEKAYAFQESHFISYASRCFGPASPWGALQGTPKKCL